MLATLWALPADVYMQDQREERKLRVFRVTFYCSCVICTKKYSPDVGGKGLTTRGNHPLPFRNAATGDPELLGRWVDLQDLGFVFINDTGKLKKSQLDIYVGSGKHAHAMARRLGVQEWSGEIR